MPIRIISIQSCSDIFPVLIKLHETFWPYHRFASELLITVNNIVFGRFISLFHLNKILMPEIRLEAVSTVLSSSELKSVIIVEIRLNCIFQSIHKTVICRLFNWKFWEKLDSFCWLLFLKVQVLKSFSPVLMVSHRWWSFIFRR